MANRFLSNVNINDEYTLPSADGTADQIITTDGAGQLNFVDQSTISSGSSEKVVIYAKNTHTASIAKGTPVYITGTVGATDTVQIAPADASNSAKMPAVGLLDETLAVNDFGYVITGGFMDNITTDPIDGVTPSSNDTVYVKSGGGLTLTKPTGSQLIQNIAKVGKVSGGNSGSLIVSSILRTNDVPNLTTGKIWVGSSTYTTESGVVHLDETNNRLGVNQTSPIGAVHIVGPNTNPAMTTSALVVEQGDGAKILIDGNDIDAAAGMLYLNDYSTNDVVFGGQIRVGGGGSPVGNSWFANGNVGVGTTSPSVKLHVDSSSYGEIAKFGNGNVQLSFGMESTHGYINAQIQGTTFRNLSLNPGGGSVGIGTTVPSQKLDVAGSAQITNDIYLGRYIFHDGDTDTWLGFPLADTISFRTNGSDRMYITSAGNVGVGTTNPSSKLTVVDDILLTGSSPSLTLTDATSSFVITTNTAGEGIIKTVADKNIRFFRNDSVETMRISATTGNVGIGTTSPSSKLQVNGDLTVGDDSTVGSFINVIAAGTSQDAGIRFGSESNTDSKAAIYTNTSNSDLHFDVTESTRMLIDSGTGNVGIGTTSPGYNLDVHGATSGIIRAYGPSVGRLSLQNSTRHYSTSVQGSSWLFFDETGGSARITINSSGNVGIGTTSPTSKLHVAQDQNNTFSTAIAWTASANDVLNITNNNSTDTNNYASLYMRADGSSGSFSSRIVARNTTAGTGELHFQLRDSAHTANTETKLMIDSGGNVGIGTTGPGAKLHVSSGTANEDCVVIIESDTDNNDETSNPRLELRQDAGAVIGRLGFRDNTNSLELINQYAESLYLGTSNSTDLTILSNGNVGIGTTSPVGRLSIGSGLSTDNSTMFNVNGQYNDVGFNGGTSGLLTQGVWSFINSATWDQTRFYVQDQNNVASRLTFDFRGNAGNTNILAGTSTGNVGIGTTSPDSKLHISEGDLTISGFNTSRFIRFTEPNNSYQGGFINYDGGANVFYFGTHDVDNTSTSNDIRAFQIARGSSNTIFNGNVGIGTTSPSHPLTIVSSYPQIKIQQTGQTPSFTFGSGSGFAVFDGIGTSGSLLDIRDDGTSRMRIDASGNVGIGTTSPTSPLHIQKTLSGGQVMAYFDGTVGPSTYGALNVRVDNIDYGTGMRFYRSGIYDSGAIGFINGTSTVGSININTSSTSYNTTSDYRLKENLTEITDGIDRIKQLKPKRFNFIGDTTVVDGFIAHEAKQVVPEAVTGEKDEVLPNGDPVYQGIDQAKIVPLLTAALQEAIAKIELLEGRIEKLEN